MFHNNVVPYNDSMPVEQGDEECKDERELYQPICKEKIDNLSTRLHSGDEDPAHIFQVIQEIEVDDYVFIYKNNLSSVVSQYGENHDSMTIQIKFNIQLSAELRNFHHLLEKNNFVIKKKKTIDFIDYILLVHSKIINKLNVENMVWVTNMNRKLLKLKKEATPKRRPTEMLRDFFVHIFTFRKTGKN